MKYVDKITIKAEQFVAGSYESVIDDAVQAVQNYAATHSVERHTDAAETVDIRFAVEATDGWDLYEAVECLQDELGGIASFTIDKRKVLR